MSAQKKRVDRSLAALAQHIAECVTTAEWGEVLKDLAQTDDRALAALLDSVEIVRSLAGTEDELAAMASRGRVA
jgi:hypothetical protein